MGMGRSVPYNMRVPKEPGDWDCPECGNMNFARRVSCNGKGGTCKIEKRPEFIRRGVESKSGGGGLNRRPGDWDCMKCGNLNYARRSECNKCDAAKPENMPPRQMMGPPGDWYCPKCNNMNYARRTQCNRKDCDFEKKDLDDYGSRMGMGNMGGPGPMPGNGPMGGAGPMGGGMGGGMGMGMGPMGGMGPGGPPMRGPPMGMPPRRRGGPEPRPGDWECPRCYNLNFSSRLRCNGTKNSEACNLAKPEFDKYRVTPVKNAANIKEGDWDCWRCGNVNFTNRDACNKCGLSKDEAQNEQFRTEGVKPEDSE